MDDNQKVNEAEQIADGELVEESSAGVTSKSADQGKTILESLESLIRENLSRIDSLSEEANKHKEMIDSVLLNDEVYKEHEEQAKTAQKTKAFTKSEILKRPDVANIALKHKELKQEIKEIKESMSSYLSEYERLSGSREIEDSKGAVMEIVYVAKLIKKRS